MLIISPGLLLLLPPPQPAELVGQISPAQLGQTHCHRRRLALRLAHLALHEPLPLGSAVRALRRVRRTRGVRGVRGVRECEVRRRPYARGPSGQPACGDLVSEAVQQLDELQARQLEAPVREMWW